MFVIRTTDGPSYRPLDNDELAEYVTQKDCRIDTAKVSYPLNVALLSYESDDHYVGVQKLTVHDIDKLRLLFQRFQHRASIIPVDVLNEKAHKLDQIYVVNLSQLDMFQHPTTQPAQKQKQTPNHIHTSMYTLFKSD